MKEQHGGLVIVLFTVKIHIIFEYILSSTPLLPAFITHADNKDNALSNDVHTENEKLIGVLALLP